jgi:hypothetical protein
VNCWNVQGRHVGRRPLSNPKRWDVAGSRRLLRSWDHHRWRSGGVLGLCCGGSYCALAQLLAWRFPGPCTRINIADCAEQLLSFGECWKIAHVQAESLAALLETAADEKGEAFELGLLRIRQRHGRRRGAQVEYERACRCSLRFGLFNGSMACCGARCRLRRWCHRIFPGPMRKPATREQEEFPDEIGVRASRQLRDRGSPAVIGILPLDRWLCVPVFRRVCPCHYKVQVSKRRGTQSSE